MKTVLNNLFEYKSLSQEQAKEVLLSIGSEAYNPAQVAAFMSVYLMRAITVEELRGFRNAMLEMCLKMEFENKETIDIVGTGGDGKNTFNISTLASIVVAGAGISVTKHGNYGVSSVSGSSNVLEAIGYRFSNDKKVLEKQLDTAGICFLHAPLFHPAMKCVAPIRKDLAVRTFFNMLGPIVNPSKPRYQLLGVYNLEMARLYNYLLQQEETIYSIVHSFDGYDEVSLTGDFKLINQEKEQVLSPENFQLKTLQQEDITGCADVESSAKLFEKILNVDGTDAQNTVVLANAALAIQCVHPQKSISECYAMAKESLESKRALTVCKKILMN